MEWIGWVGAVAFALCALPQAMSCWQRGNATGLSGSFLFLWTVGEVCCFAYVAAHPTGVRWPLVMNYLLNLGLLGIIWRYWLWPVTTRVSSEQRYKAALEEIAKGDHRPSGALAYLAYKTLRRKG